MTKMNSIAIKALLVFTFLVSFSIQAQNTVSPEDLGTLLGEWAGGSITYMDYSTNKPFSMPAKVLVKQSKNGYQLTLDIRYPKEPHANSKDKIRLSKDGTQLNNHEVTSRQKLPDGDLRIIIEYSGKDNKKKALIKNIYIIGKTQFIIRKEVQFENSEEWLMRNEYKFVR